MRVTETRGLQAPEHLSLLRRYQIASDFDLVKQLFEDVLYIQYAVGSKSEPSLRSISLITANDLSLGSVDS